jgi:hypothetical protein
MFQQERTLIQEQNSGEGNTLYKIIHTRRNTHAPKQDTDALNTTTTKQSVTTTKQDTDALNTTTTKQSVTTTKQDTDALNNHNKTVSNNHKTRH